MHADHVSENALYIILIKTAGKGEFFCWFDFLKSSFVKYVFGTQFQWANVKNG